VQRKIVNTAMADDKCLTLAACTLYSQGRQCCRGHTTGQ